jgi:hypothetical protein
LLEELGVTSEIGDEILVTEHAYPERTVRLHFRRCQLHDDPQPLLGQAMRWATRDESADDRLPRRGSRANRPAHFIVTLSVMVSPSLTTTLVGTAALSASCQTRMS